MKKQLFIIACHLIFIVTGMGITSCSNDEGGNFAKGKIVKATIKDAKYLYRAAEGSRSSGAGGGFFSVDQYGNAEPIRFITEKGDIVDMPILDIFDINEKYIIMMGNFIEPIDEYSAEVFSYILADKVSGAIYRMPEFVHDFRYKSYTDSEGGIYLANGSMIYKLDTDNMTVSEYIPKGQWFNDYIITSEGVAYYSGRFRIPQGGTYLMETLILELHEYGVFLGFDGNLYAYNQTESGMSIYKIEYDLQNNVLTANVVADIDIDGNFFRVNFIPNHVRRSHIISGDHGENVLEFNEAAKSLQKLNIELPATEVDNDYIISADALYMKTSSTSIIKLNLANNTVSSLNLLNAGYEVYVITASQDKSEVSFSGLRLSDSKNIIGQIDKNGDITAFDNVNLSSKVISLIRLN